MMLKFPCDLLAQAGFSGECAVILRMGQGRLKAALEKPGAEKRGAARAKALTGLAYMARYQSDLLASQGAAQEAVDIWREVGDKWWLAFTLGRVGGNLLIQGDLIGARRI